MAKHIIVPFEQWETTSTNGVERRYFRMGATLMASEQMRSLSSSAFKIYCYMRIESGGKRSFKFPNTKYRSFMSKPTFQKVKQELINKGFIDEVRNNSNLRKANIYAFSDRWKTL